MPKLKRLSYTSRALYTARGPRPPASQPPLNEWRDMRASGEERLLTIDVLLNQHDELRALSSRLDALVRQPVPDPKSLSPIRHAMSSLMRKHLTLEDELVYSPLRAHAETSAEMRRSDADLAPRRQAYSSHVVAWTPERITSDWSGYRRGVTVLTEGLTSRIDYETDILYPLLDRLR